NYAENTKAIGRGGGVEAAVVGMLARRSLVGVQQKGCWALGNLAVEAVNKTAIARAGGIATVVAGMGAHPTIAGVQQTGCRALRKLASKSDENRTAVVRAGG
ncbi:hypothetical protein T484DRAFT_1603867, partial [Baffinella frigidus]